MPNTTTIKQPIVTKSDPQNYPYLSGLLIGIIRGMTYDMPEAKRAEILQQVEDAEMKSRAYQKGISLYEAKRV